MPVIVNLTVNSPEDQENYKIIPLAENLPEVKFAQMVAKHLSNQRIAEI